MIFMTRMFLERLSSQGITSSKYYQDSYFNHAKGTINDMPNCTDYTVCRTNEACDTSTPLQMFRNMGAGNFPNADLFYDYSILPKGSELKPGSIACFDRNGGSMHVIFVERVYDDGYCLITDSRYDPNKSLRNDRYWRKIDHVRLQVGKHAEGVPGCGILQGFIYLPINDIRGRNSLVNQVEVTQEMVNVRVSPEGDILIPGCFCPMGFYTIQETRIVNDYTWFKLQDNVWIREGEWTKLYPATEDEKQKEIDTLNKRIEDAITILSGGQL